MIIIDKTEKITPKIDIATDACAGEAKANNKVNAVVLAPVSYKKN
jgi:hypothetical protein